MFWSLSLEQPPARNAAFQDNMCEEFVALFD
jgi:hypothetical protein